MLRTSDGRCINTPRENISRHFLKMETGGQGRLSKYLPNFIVKGGVEMKFSLKKLKKELLSKIDNTDQLQLEKVQRYLNLVEVFYQLDKYIQEQGLVVLTVNGSQEFLKTNPALQEKNKVNSQILAIEKTFDFKVDNKIQDDGSDLI